MGAAYVIGIGGSGSKCVESFLHVSASGLGPDRIGLALVDQDLSNGNLTKTKQLLSLYRGLHTEFHQGINRLANCSLLHTDFTTADTPEWSPLREKSATLAGHFNYKSLRDESRMLFECLFEPRFERDQPLEEGFRGRPAMGAAAMFSAAASRSHFWDKLFDDMERTADDEEVKVFLFASIFGGTGASGFPTIAKIIREMAEEKSVRVRIGGVLLLPYFQYPDPPESVERQSVALSKEFTKRSRQALDYYHDLLTHQHPDLYDQVYLVGFDPVIEIDYFREGGSLQKNMPLIPELLSALAALHFFQDNENITPRILRAGRSTRNVSWDQIPRVDLDAQGHDVRQSLGRLIRFAMAFSLSYYPHLQPNTYTSFQHQAWFKRLISDVGVDLRSDNAQAALTALAKYCNEVLMWAASLCSSDGLAADIDLFDFGRIAVKESGVKLKLGELKAYHKQAFRHVIPPGAHHGLDDIFERMSWPRTRDNGRGLGVFLQRLFDECGV